MNIQKFQTNSFLTVCTKDHFRFIAMGLEDIRVIVLIIENFRNVVN